MTKAIITGDLIHSTRMKAEQRSKAFGEIAKELKVLDKNFGMKSETFRGDSFQCLIHNPADALKISLLQKTFIRSLKPETKRKQSFPNWVFDARIAIGIGEVDSTTGKLATSGGVAFTLSGHLLDKIKNKKQALAIATNDGFNDELETACILLDAIISRTSPLQCEVIRLKLLGFNEVEIAQQLSIGQSAVNQRSNSGNWNAIEAMVKRFEKIYAR